MASLNSAFVAKAFPNSVCALQELYDGKKQTYWKIYLGNYVTQNPVSYFSLWTTAV